MKNLFTSIVVLFVLGMHLRAQTPVQPAGSGTEQSPYQVTSVENLLWIATTPASLDKHFVQINDIDAAATATWTNGYVPIGVFQVQAGGFTGVYNGQGYKITDLQIVSTSQWNSIGVFGAASGTISNLGVENMTIEYINATMVGGIVGWLRPGGQINNCYVKESAIHGAGMTGGLVGSATQAFIDKCYAHAVVQGSSVVGGLVGTANSSEISNSYSRSSVSGTQKVGGFIGDVTDAMVVNCYSSGLVSGDDDFGGFAGFGQHDVMERCYWNQDVSQQTSSAGYAYPLTTAQMTYPYDAFPFVNYPYFGTWAPDINGNQNDGYLYLSQDMPELFTQGEGTEQSPYLIASAQELYNIRYIPTAHYKLMNNIDLGVSPWNDERGWAPICVSQELWEFSQEPGFEGTFNGQNFEISNMTINAPNDWDNNGYGLFGIIQSTGKVHNLYVTNIEMQIPAFFGGAIAGYNHGIIERCFSSGEIFSAFHYTGGIAGWNENEISECYSGVNVGDAADNGGIAGSNSGLIKNAYSYGNITTGMRSGGIVGDNGGTIENCYSSGVVSELALSNFPYAGPLVSETFNEINSYWDYQNYGLSSPLDNHGRSTAQMKTQATFNNWDFDDIWGIEEGDTYPFLKWTLESTTEIFNLNLVADPIDGGELQGAGNYEEGETVNLTATANTDYVFVHWADENGNVLSTLENFAFTMPASNVTLTAHFNQDIMPSTYTLTLIASPEEGGVLQGEGTYEAGETVNLLATPNSDFSFLHWADDNGNVLSTTENFAYTMPNEDVALTAHFTAVINAVDELEQSTVNVFPNPSSGSVTITSSENSMGSYYFIFDYQGRMVKRGVIDNVNMLLDFSDFENGVYIFQLQGTATRIIKQ